MIVELEFIKIIQLIPLTWNECFTNNVYNYKYYYIGVHSSHLSLHNS